MGDDATRTSLEGAKSHYYRDRSAAVISRSISTMAPGRVVDPFHSTKMEAASRQRPFPRVENCQRGHLKGNQGTKGRIIWKYLLKGFTTLTS
jgi:hypothetical protein